MNQRHAGRRRQRLERAERDEELLILRGMELGLAESSPEIRKAIAASVIAQVVAEAEARPPAEEDLRRLYESDPGFFTSSARYRLQWLRLRGSDELARHSAAQVYQALSTGVPVEELMISTGLERLALLPDALLPLSKIRDYLGSELARRVPDMAPGDFSEPMAANGDFHILFLAQHEAGVLPDFEQARPLLEAEYLRREGDKALRRYLAWLRQRAEIIVDQEKVNPP